MWPALRQPILGILHIGYLWLPVGLLLNAFAHQGLIWSPRLALHALTMGAIGTITLAMLTRVARGHTGRPLHVHWVTVVGYFLVIAAAIIRLVLPAWAPAYTFPSIVVAAILWTAGFAIYLVRYAPILLRPRVDGKPG